MESGDRAGTDLSAKPSVTGEISAAKTIAWRLPAWLGAGANLRPPMTADLRGTATAASPERRNEPALSGARDHRDRAAVLRRDLCREAVAGRPARARGDAVSAAPSPILAHVEGCTQVQGYALCDVIHA